jgi:hypothetical protein
MAIFLSELDKDRIVAIGHYVDGTLNSQGAMGIVCR